MSSAAKFDIWVGLLPLKSALSESAGEPDPRMQLAKIYESLETVLHSLWSHHLRHEASEISTLLVAEQGTLLAELLEKQSHGFFSASESQQSLASFVARGHTREYPGHSVICLFILARARDNVQMIAASQLCESIAECLGRLQEHLNHGTSDTQSAKSSLEKLSRCWKKTFPYSE